MESIEIIKCKPGQLHPQHTQLDLKQFVVLEQDDDRPWIQLTFESEHGEWSSIRLGAKVLDDLHTTMHRIEKILNYEP